MQLDAAVGGLRRSLEQNNEDEGGRSVELSGHQGGEGGDEGEQVGLDQSVDRQQAERQTAVPGRGLSQRLDSDSAKER